MPFDIRCKKSVLVPKAVMTIAYEACIAQHYDKTKHDPLVTGELDKSIPQKLDALVNADVFAPINTVKFL